MGPSWAAIGISVTVAMFLAGVVFNMGRVSARIEELERWRLSIRIDMHEISDRLEDMSTNLKHLATLIEERTERRRAGEG